VLEYDEAYIQFENAALLQRDLFDAVDRENRTIELIQAQIVTLRKALQTSPNDPDKLAQLKLAEAQLRAATGTLTITHFTCAQWCVAFLFVVILLLLFFFWWTEVAGKAREEKVAAAWETCLKEVSAAESQWKSVVSDITKRWTNFQLGIKETEPQGGLLAGLNLVLNFVAPAVTNYTTTNNNTTIQNNTTTHNSTNTSNAYQTVTH